MIKLVLKDHLRAHRNCRNNREELSRSEICGCFYCMAIYAAREISEWVDEDQTALCTRCGIDSVIPQAAGYPITLEFMQKMRDYWFSTAN